MSAKKAAPKEKPAPEPRPEPAIPCHPPDHGFDPEKRG